MSFNSEFGHVGHEPFIFDLESCPLADVRPYVDPPDLDSIKAPGNYKKPEAIAQFIEDEKISRVADYERDLVDKAALDWNTARICCLGWQLHGEQPLHDTIAIRDEAVEAAALTSFWTLADGRPLVGFRIREFDLPMLIQRSRYLGVKPLTVDLGRYARSGTVIDLYDLLTFNDLRTTFLMRRTLQSFARRFGIPVEDQTSGKDIAGFIAAGDYASVVAHCRSDVALTYALAKRVGAVRDFAPVGVL